MDQTHSTTVSTLHTRWPSVFSSFLPSLHARWPSVFTAFPVFTPLWWYWKQWGRWPPTMQGALQCLEVPGTLTCQSLTVARGAAHCNARRIDMPVAGSRKRGSALSHGLESCDSKPRVTPALFCPMVRHVSLHTFSTHSSLKCPAAHTVTHERRFTRAPCANTSACGAFEAL